MEEKYHHIREFESKGLKIPRNRGGGFLPIFPHLGGIVKIQSFLEKYNRRQAKNADGNDFTVRWNAPPPDGSEQKFVLSIQDLLAYTEWAKNSRHISKQPHGLEYFEDFAVNYLNIAKIGTTVDYGTHNDCIVTADTMPYTKFEDWVRDGFQILHLQDRYNFDITNSRFTPLRPSAAEAAIEREKRAQLEEELGRDL